MNDEEYKKTEEPETWQATDVFVPFDESDEFVSILSAELHCSRMEARQIMYADGERYGYIDSQRNDWLNLSAYMRCENNRILDPEEERNLIENLGDDVRFWAEFRDEVSADFFNALQNAAGHGWLTDVSRTETDDNEMHICFRNVDFVVLQAYDYRQICSRYW